MGELIQVDFPIKNGEKLPEEAELLDIDRLTSVVETVSHCLGTIANKKESIHKENQGLYGGLVAGYTDEELIGWINNANDRQISEKPLFFQAVIDESKKRPFFPTWNN